MPRPKRICRVNSYAPPPQLNDVDAEASTCSTRRRTTQGTKRKSTSLKVPRDINNTIIVLDDSDDDCVSTIISRSRIINENVKNKVEDTFKSSGLFSDDEDDPYLPSSSNKPNDNINVNEPSSSASEGTVFKPTKSQRVINIEDDLSEINTIEDIQNYCKETEDILKKANAVLEKFAETRKSEEPPTKYENSNKEKNINQDKGLECRICYESLSEKQVMSTKCGHLFCKTCIETIAVTIKKCPICRKVVNKKNIIAIYI